MEMSEKDKLELEKRSENSIIDWRFSNQSISNSTLSLDPSNNPMPACRENLIGASSCSSASMVGLWGHPANSQNLGVCDVSVQNQPTTSNPPSSMLKGGIFMPEILPHSLSQFPAESAFIERAARFSCFNGGNFSDMVSPFGLPEPVGLFARSSGGSMHGPQEVFAGVSQKNVADTEKMTIEGRPMKNDRKSDGLVRSNDEAKQGVGGSSNEPEETEFSGGGGQDDPNIGELSSKSLDSKKRKRNLQNTEINQKSVEVANGGPEVQQKAAGKQGKRGSEPSKEEYIHVRAQRGQATNSHSLAERVRREKISERMKFLQDLVPGCSKVTGKAVMLDEIINYVQSLQRQVEFLSMKLATVNPRLDFNIDSLLAKDMLHSRTIPCSSSSLAFSPDMPIAYPPFNAGGLIQPPFCGTDNNSNVLRRTIMTGGFKEPTQIPSSWDEELHNVVQMR